MRSGPIGLICLIGLTTLMNLTALASDRIEYTIRTFLKENYPWPEIEIKDLSVNANPPASEIKQLYIDRMPPGRVAFTLHYSSGERLIVTANIKAFDWVVMSRRAQSKGYELKEEDLYRARMDVTKIPRGAIKEINEATGKRLRHSIIANSPLTANLLLGGEVIKKGSRVSIVVESPSFVIRAMGELKENGYIGSAVRAINLSSRKTVTGILIDKDTLKVNF